MNKKGHCLCQNTLFSFTGDVNWVGNCYCESCRRQTASPYTSFLSVQKKLLRYHRDKPRVYESSPGVKRYFCATCGAPIAYESEKYSQETHLYVALMENPSDYVPTKQYHYDEKLSFVPDEAGAKNDSA